MPKVVSNTTPIISLLKINRLDLLKQLYTQIYIPEAVYKEIEAGKTKEFYKDLSKIDWIKISELKPLLNELTKKDVWISEKLKREILIKTGEI